MEPLVITPVALPVPPPGAVSRRLRVAGRSAARHLVPLLARRVARRPLAENAAAAGLRRVFDDLGGTFTKFGQLIGSASSLFGEAVSEEFRGCLDAGPPAPFDAVRRTVEAELGRPLPVAFAAFDETPLAAASIAVVHGAVLHDGTPVAVKVLRPGIEESVATDLAVLRPLLGWLGRNVAVGIAGTLPGLVDGLEEQVREELDLTNEARSLGWFGELVGVMGLPLVRVPRLIGDLSTQRVLVMELVDGMPIDAAEEIAAAGIDPRPAIVQTLEAFFAATLCTGCFHGDVHAGNLFVDGEGRVVVLDWGIVGRLDDPTQRFFRRCIEGVLGDELAWRDVGRHLDEASGGTFSTALGLDERQLDDFVRLQVEPLFLLPFGQVDLRTMLIGGGEPSTPTSTAARSKRDRVRFWWEERRKQQRLAASGLAGTGLDRGMFLLSKQLVYLDRYGKLYLPDVPLLWDREVFVRLLANEPLVGAA